MALAHITSQPWGTSLGSIPPPSWPCRRGDIVAVVNRPLTGVPSGYRHPKSSSRSQHHPRALSAAGRRDRALDPMGSMGDKGVSAPPTLAGGCSPPKSWGMVPIAFPHKTTFAWEDPPLSITGSASIPAPMAPDQPTRSRQPGWARGGTEGLATLRGQNSAAASGRGGMVVDAVHQAGTSSWGMNFGASPLQHPRDTQREKRGRALMHQAPSLRLNLGPDKAAEPSAGVGAISRVCCQHVSYKPASGLSSLEAEAAAEGRMRSGRTDRLRSGRTDRDGSSVLRKKSSSSSLLSGRTGCCHQVRVFLGELLKIFKAN